MRAIILEVEVDKLYVDLVDLGRKDFVPRTSVFEMPSKYYMINTIMYLYIYLITFFVLFFSCKLFEMCSLNVVVDKPHNFAIDKNSFVQNCYKMLPLKTDPNYGLYKVKLFQNLNGILRDVFNTMINDSVVDHSILNKSTEIFTITKINVCINIFLCLKFYSLE